MDIEDFDKLKFLKDLGANVARVRKAKGFSQDRLCLDAGFSRGAISKIESGRVEPKVSTLAIIAITLGVPLSKIISAELK